MNTWKTIGQIAACFAIVCFVFAALAAFITYEGITMQSSLIPASYIQLSVVSAMLPFLLLAILSLITALATLRAEKETTKKEPQPAAQSAETKL